MKHFSVLGLALVLIMALNTGPALAAAFKLDAWPLSGTAVKLEWEPSYPENDVWKTVYDEQKGYGQVWKKVYESTGSSNTAVIDQNIQPYNNYYFIVTKATGQAVGATVDLADSTDPTVDFFSNNASNEAVVFPPNQDAHRFYTKDTNMCQYCHDTHEAVGPKLLVYATVNDTCISCHDGTGSKYRVAEGQVSSDGTLTAPLTAPAGPFGEINGRQATANPAAIHTLGANIASAPGGGTGSGQLGCAGCHQAHDSDNFRMLSKVTPFNNNVSVRGYAYTDLAADREVSFYVSGINDFCLGCHQNYGANSIGSGSTPDSSGSFHHRVGASLNFKGQTLTTSLPLEGWDNPVISCPTCHVAHGSNSKPFANKQGDLDGGSDETNFLLRQDGLGVCQDCHKK